MPSRRPLSILQISTRDLGGGGAEKVAQDLSAGFRSHGHDAHLAVGFKRGDDPHVSEIPHGEHAPPLRCMAWDAFQGLQPLYGRVPGAKAACRLAHDLASPRRRENRLRGIEDFDYPGTAFVDRLSPRRPDILHAHNLHGGYFDLRALPELSRRYPMVLTLHDAWLLSGHCAHSFDCTRWETGCGQCPDLSIYPAVTCDATDENWKRKRDIFSRCRLHVATPCAWLMDRVERSMLAPGVVSSRVFPYGVDQDVYHPGDRREARRQLGIDPRCAVVLFAAHGIRGNVFKDYATLQAGVARVAAHREPGSLVCLALGESAPASPADAGIVRFVPFTSDAHRVATYYRAADVYVHAARADTFPNAVLEALSCGICVVGSSVGGIPEQIRSLDRSGADRGAGVDQATGILVPECDAEAMGDAIARLLDDDALRERLHQNAATDARRRFDVRRHVRDYLRWYEEILGVTVSRADEATSARAANVRAESRVRSRPEAAPQRP